MGRDIKNHMNPQLLEALEDLAHMYAGRPRPDATGAASATADAPMAAPPVENLQAFFEGLPSTQLKAVTLIPEHRRQLLGVHGRERQSYPAAEAAVLWQAHIIA